jgi:hypothetical protein
MFRLHRLVPRCFAELCSPAGLELAGVAQELLVRAVQGDATGQEHFEAHQEVQKHIRAWLARWNLVAVPINVSKGEQDVPEWRSLSERERKRWKGSSSEYSWIEDVADATLRYWVVNEKYGGPVPVTFVARAPAAARTMMTTHHGEPFPWDMKAYQLAPYLRSDGGLDLLLWNPRTETRADAKKRLSRLLDNALDRIEREAAWESPSRSIPDDHFDWLVRFQVKPQSQNDIAERVGLSRRHITRAVNDVAEYIGIEPRDGRRDGGRPSSKKPRTVKV